MAYCCISNWQIFSRLFLVLGIFGWHGRSSCCNHDEFSLILESGKVISTPMKGFIWAFVLLVGVYAAYSIFRIISNTAPDFSVYYGVAKNALEGRGIYGDPKLFTGYGYPPYSVLPYLPFALLSYGVSQTLFTLLSFISLVASVFLSFGLFAPKAKFETKMIATAIAFLMFPTLFT